VRSWKASGKKRAGFAADKDYSERSLGWWAWKLGTEGETLDAKPGGASRPQREKAKALELVELLTPAAGPEPLTMRVGTIDIVVGRGFDRELLGGVLDVLEARR